MEENKKLSTGQKAAKIRMENYAKASAEEKARIDEIRHLAAVKAIQTRKSKKIKPLLSSHKEKEQKRKKFERERKEAIREKRKKELIKLFYIKKEKLRKEKDREYKDKLKIQIKNKKSIPIDKSTLSGGKILYNTEKNHHTENNKQPKEHDILDKFKKQFEYENVNQIFKENEGNKEFFEGIKDTKNDTNEENEIQTECELLVKNYKRRGGLEDTVFDDFIDAFEYCKKEYPNPINSLKSLINKTDFEIRASFRNLLRVPDKLREFVNDGKLSFDPILSKEIAIHANDVFQWDGQKELEDKVFQFAIDMSKCFSDPNNLDMKKEFFTNPVDKTTPISGPSKTAQLNTLKEKHPVVPSPFDRYRDRTQFDYWKLVSIKNLKIAAFVLKWEHDHRQRISKKWAYELIRDPEKFFSEHKSEL